MVGISKLDFSQYIKKNGEMKMNKQYRLYDMQDEENSEIVSLQSAKDWLIGFWCNNNDGEMTDEELDVFIEKIENADFSKLSEFLQGIDYDIEEIEKE